MTSAQKKRALRAQISLKKSIVFKYKGEEREGNPHTLGISNGEYALRIYQTAGDSESGLKKKGSAENFRFFYLKDIDIIEEQNTNFKPHPAYKENDEAFEKIDTQINNGKSK